MTEAQKKKEAEEIMLKVKEFYTRLNEKLDNLIQLYQRLRAKKGS